MNSKNVLWYQQPATYWEEALPVGNGRLGAMVYGRSGNECIQLNEESLWSGPHKDRINPEFLPNLEKLQGLIHEGQIGEAERLARKVMTGITPYQNVYETFGTLNIRYVRPGSKRGFPSIPWIEDPCDPDDDYERSLDLNTALAESRWERDNTVYTQEVFASAPADAIFVHITAVGEQKLELLCHFERGKRYTCAGKLELCMAETDATESGVEKHSGCTCHDTQVVSEETREANDCKNGSTYTFPALAIAGKNSGMTFAGAVQVVSCDGTAEIQGEYLEIKDATEVTLAFTAYTSFRKEDPLAEVKQTLQNVLKKSFEEHKKEHIADYKALFERLEIQFKNEDSRRQADIEALPTDLRLKRIQGGNEDPDFAAMYFQYGRYLAISGSRPGGVPMTLQGIWNEDFEPMWDSKYTININLEMNYWPIDMVNLSECYEPYFSLLKRVAESGKDTAKRMYGCRGFTAHHNTDIYADTVPQEFYIPASYWPMGGAWLSTHIWDHYLFTRDAEFLKEMFPVLREAILFFADFLKKGEDGYLRTSPSCSPENIYILPTGEGGCLTEGCTMDNQILERLFADGIAAAEELLALEKKQSTEDAKREYHAFAELCATLKKQLPPTKIGSKGQILEWKEEYEEEEPGHRHISHVYGVYPGDIYTFEKTPELMNAARRSVELRLENGGGHTGWSRAWITILWARFRDAKQAGDSLHALFADSTYTNLMDFHPLPGYKRGNVFQIDGNFGGITAISEMLVQSHGDRLVLLPALPESLSSGSIHGLRVRGGILSMKWEKGVLEKATLTANHDFITTVQYQDRAWELQAVKGEEYKLV